MKKPVSLALSALLTIGMLAGCAQNTSNGPVNGGAERQTESENTADNASDNSPDSAGGSASSEDEQTAAQTDQTAGTETADAKEDTSPWKTDSAKEAVSLYEDFMAGKVTANANTYVDAGMYTLTGLIDALSLRESETGMPDMIFAGSYSIIDCGDDGEPELALALDFGSGYENSPYSTYYIILRRIFGELTVITCRNSYYRTYTQMNRYGYFFGSGSGGASLSFTDECFVSADGEYFTVYTCETCFGLDEPKISSYLLPDSLSEAVSGTSSYEGDYYMEAYAFDETLSETYGDIDFDTYYSAIARQKVYSFYNMDEDEGITPDKEYIDLCAENGLKIVTDDELKKILEDRYRSLGITEEIRNADANPDWIAFDVRDRVSKNAQIDLFMASSDMWLLPESDIEPGSYVKYVITDLNRNGRYELIRSEKLGGNRFNVRFCRNRFFEINRDYTGITKLDYESEYYWNDELTGWEHDILEASADNIICYWCEAESDSGEFRRTYDYIVPAYQEETAGDCIATNKLVLSFDGDDHIPHGFSLGMSFVYNNGYADYMDSEGLTCSEDDFDFGNENFVYGSGDYNEDMVHIGYVELDPSDPESIKENLLQSAGEYWFYAFSPATAAGY